MESVSEQHFSQFAVAVCAAFCVLEPLPDIKTSKTALDKTKPLPTTLQSEFIPDEVLLAITQPPPAYEKLGPPSRYRNLDTSAVRETNDLNCWTDFLIKIGLVFRAIRKRNRLEYGRTRKAALAFVT